MLGSLSRDQRLRLLLLASVMAMVTISLGRSWLQPKHVAKTAAYTLPVTVPLPDWQFVGTQPIAVQKAAEAPGANGPIATTATQSSNFTASQRYQYQRGGIDLRIDTYYFSEYTDGNITRYIFVYTPLRSANVGMEERQSAVGHYGVLTHEGRAYLTACTAVQGISTLTEQQFTQNQSQSSFSAKRIVAWLTGERKLSDNRCLWTLMSIPITGGANATGSDRDAAYQTLETLWVPWHRWWQQHFPR